MGKQPRKRLGEILLEKDLLTHDQLTDALKKAHQSGIKLGASLILLGHVTEDQILASLSESLRVPFIDMSREVITAETQLAFPYELVKAHNVVPVKQESGHLTVAMPDPTDYWLVEDLRHKTGQAIQPVLASSHQLGEIIKFFEKNGYARKPYELGQLRKAVDRVRTLTIDELLRELVKRDASDLHLSVGAAPSVRVNNRLVRLDLPFLDVQTALRFTNSLLTEEQKERLNREHEIEITYMRDDVGRFRVVIYRQRRSLTICARNLKTFIPQLEEMPLPRAVRDLLLRPSGLLLVTGPPGHGKSTTVAAMVDFLNRSLPANIVTLEDPIEFLFKHKEANVNQREIGEDTPDIVSGLRRVFRQNPDIIMIGDLREPEAIARAVQAAVTGQLVIASMHATSSTSALDSIVNYFTGNQQNVVKQQLADSLLCVLAQRLVPRRSGNGRVLASEVLFNSPRVASHIRTCTANEIRKESTASSGDMISLDAALAAHCRNGLVSMKDAARFCDDADVFQTLATA